METPNFEMPQPSAFNIPYNPRKLRFQSEFMDKHRFQKLQVDRKLIKAFNNHLMSKIDKDVLFYLKFTGQGDSLIKYQDNKVSYYRNKHLFNAGVAPFEYPVTAEDIVLYHLNESNFPTDDAKDEVAGNDATVSGCLSKEGKVLSPGGWFDGINDEMYRNDATTGDITTEDFTAECWVRPEAAGKDAIPCAKQAGDRGYQFYTIGGNMYAYIWDGVNAANNYATGIGVTVGSWQHIAYSFERAGNLTLYKNGVLSGTPQAATAIGSLTNAGNFMMGAKFHLDTEYSLQGNLDEVRVSKIARTVFGGVAPGVIM